MSSTATRLLKSALLALANIDAIRAAVSADDLAEYPEFANLMATSGGGLDWRSFKVTGADGYITTLWNITGDNSNPTQSTRGPVLLQHGWWSDGMGWMARSDATSNAFPTKLYELGFDVWIANDRSVAGLTGHTTKDRSLDPTYFDYCFVEEAMNDLPA